MAGQILAGLRTGNWLTRSRATGYLTLLVIANVVGLALAICRAHGWLIPEEKHFSTEFLSFYAAGRLVDAGQAAAAYAPGEAARMFIRSFHQPPAHRAMEQAVAHDSKVIYFGFFYPPVFLLLCAPLALLPYVTAQLTWVAATGGFLSLLLRRLLGTWRDLWPVFGFLAVIENAGVGENAFLSASLVGFGLLNLDRRPWLAGMCFGALCYKPHFLLPVAVLLLAGRHFRAVGSGVLTTLALGLASVAAFGWQNWITYFAVIVPHADFLFGHAGIAYDLQVTPVSAARLLGGGHVIAMVAQAAGIAFGAFLIFSARHAAPNIRAAMLCASFPLMLPVMLDYDLTTTGLAIVFLLREANSTGFRPYEKTVLAVMFAMPWITWIFRTDLHLPIDPLIPSVFMLLLRARLSQADPAATMSAPPHQPRPAA